MSAHDRDEQKDKENKDRIEQSAWQERHLITWGLDVEALGETLRRLPNRWPFVYNVQLRLPIRDNADVLMLVKAVGEGGPVIAFHGGRTMVTALITWPARVRAGKVEWREDIYPPGNYAEIEDYILKEVEYFEKTGINYSQGLDGNGR